MAKAGPYSWEAWEQTQWCFHGDTVAQDQGGTRDETQQHRTKWGQGMRRVASAWCGWGNKRWPALWGAKLQNSSQGEEDIF